MKYCFTVLLAATVLCVATASFAQEPPAVVAPPSLAEEINALKRELSLLKAQRADDVRILVPVGTIVAYTGNIDNNTPLEGWLLCDGKTKLDKPQYEDLKRVLGGADNVPDYRGYFLRGLDPTEAVDTEKGRKLGSKQPDTFSKHAHLATVSGEGKHIHFRQGKDKGSGGNGPYPNIIYKSDVGKNGQMSQGARRDSANQHNIRNDHGERFPPDNSNWSEEYQLTRKDGNHTHTVTVKPNKENGNETRPKNIAVNWIVKY